MNQNKFSIGLTFGFSIFFLALLLQSCGKEEEKSEFLWGTAISGFQSDMGPEVPPDVNSDWWVWMHDEKNRKEKLAGKDMPEDGPAFWKHYKEDLKMAKEIGTNVFRYSIEWSRIFPTSTRDIEVKVKLSDKGYPIDIVVDQDAVMKLFQRANRESLEKYREILSYAKSIGLKIFLTLNHFTLPIWIHDPLSCRDWFEENSSRGRININSADICYGKPAGWLSNESIIEFAKFSAFSAWYFQDLVDWWGAINEPVVVAQLGYLLGRAPSLVGFGSFPPAWISPDAFIKVLDNLILASAISYNVIHTFDQKDSDGDGIPAKVSLIYNITYYEPYSDSDNKASESAWNLLVFKFLDGVLLGQISGKRYNEIKSKADIIGINYYNRVKLRYLEIFPEIDLSFFPASSLEIFPAGIYYVVKRIWERYKGLGLPILITENGVADSSDEIRAWFIEEHANYVKKLISEGIPVIGYFYWSLIDNLEWNAGYSQKFGLIEVDFNSPNRTRKLRQSAQKFSEIIKKGKL